MSGLSYKSSGVDITANNDIKDRLKAVLTPAGGGCLAAEIGLFGGGVGLSAFCELERPFLYAGFAEKSASSDFENAAKDVSVQCSKSCPDAVAFMDYIAASRIQKNDFFSIIDGLSKNLAGYPIAGGETAEMPGVFKPGCWEIIGVSYGVCNGEKPGTVCCSLEEIKHMKEPLLIMSMDGVGTKVGIGVQFGKTDTLIADIVGHSVNDILCQGAYAKAMVFYVGCHTADEKIMKSICDSALQACKNEGIVNLGVYTSEQPDIYEPGQYDVCGSIAGLVEKSAMLPRQVLAGEVIIGFPSSGLHTNGYSLARAALKKAGISYEQRFDGLPGTIGEALLEPHRSYAAEIIAILRDYPVSAVAHITGGGFQDNIERVLKDDVCAVIEKNWEIPKLFQIIQQSGGILDHDPENKGMYETFNMGIGIVITVPEKYAEEILKKYPESRQIGYIEQNLGTMKVRFA